jgi:N-acetyl-alpha-D-muramate 1-phosphate uridylyltransferase
MTMAVAILAGGLGTRLRPVTQAIPKALVPVAGRPFVDHQLALLRRQGYTEVVVCAGHLGEMIEQHLGDGSRWGMKIRFAFDGPQLLGTGGALRRALPMLAPAFFVLYGDSYLPCDLRSVEQAFLSSGLPALMTVFRNEDRWDQSNVIFAQDKVIRYDKRNPSGAMRHIDYGLGALHAAVLESYQEGAAFDLGDVYAELAAQGRLAGLEVGERFYEIGSAAGLADTERYLSTHSSAEPAS